MYYFLILFLFFFFLNDPPPPELYPLPLHDALPISPTRPRTSPSRARCPPQCPKRLRRGAREQPRRNPPLLVLDAALRPNLRSIDRLRPGAAQIGRAHV